MYRGRASQDGTSAGPSFDVHRTLDGKGRRTFAAKDVFEGLSTTRLEPDEMTLRIGIPVRRLGWSCGFHWVSRRCGEFAQAGLTIARRVEGGLVVECSLVLRGVEAVPRRLHAAEAGLTGQPPGAPEALAAAMEAPAEFEPLGDGTCTAAYRLPLARTLPKRQLAHVGEIVGHAE